jgi:RNA polymerase sigma factor (sigma-70 family)
MLISTAYLLRIAENLIRRKYERSQRYRVILERSGMVVSDSSEDRCASRMLGGSAGAQGAVFGDDTDRLQAVLRQLTDEEQTAVRLIVCEGLDYQAAARSLGVPVSTINNWKYRGLSKLRRLIEPAPEQQCAVQFPRRTAAAG